MSAIVRSARHLSLPQLAVLALSLVACATAVQQEAPDDEGGGGSGSAGGSVTTAGTSTSAGTSPGTSGASTGGSAGQGSGGTKSTAGTASTAGTTSTAGSTSTAGAAGTGSTGTCPPYAGSLAQDSAIFNGGFGASTTGTWTGYGYTYKFGTATVTPGMGTSCFSGKKFCASGTIPADDASGAGLGWNIAQAMGATTTMKVAITTPVKITFAGITAATGARVQISESATTSYCYTLSAAEATAGTATIPLASFKTKCWDTTGVAYAGTPIEAIQISVPGAAAAGKTFDLCVLDVEPG